MKSKGKKRKKKGNMSKHTFELDRSQWPRRYGKPFGIDFFSPSKVVEDSYVDAIPVGEGRYVRSQEQRRMNRERASRKRERDIKAGKPSTMRKRLSPQEINQLQDQYELSKQYQIDDAASCYYGIPSRRIWNAVVSCLQRQEPSGVSRLSDASRLASPFYHQVMDEAEGLGLADEEIVEEILNRINRVKQRQGRNRVTQKKQSFPITSQKTRQRKPVREKEEETKETKQQRRRSSSPARYTVPYGPDSAAANLLSGFNSTAVKLGIPTSLISALIHADKDKSRESQVYALFDILQGWVDGLAPEQSDKLEKEINNELPYVAKLREKYYQPIANSLSGLQSTALKLGIPDELIMSLIDADKKKMSPKQVIALFQDLQKRLAPSNDKEKEELFTQVRSELPYVTQVLETYRTSS